MLCVQWSINRPLAKRKKVEKNKDMKYENIKNYSDEQFRRITGVKRKTFDDMTAILIPKHKEKFSRGGRKPKLSIEEMLLASLEYWREYRTYAHMKAICTGS